MNKTQMNQVQAKKIFSYLSVSFAIGVLFWLVLNFIQSNRLDFFGGMIILLAIWAVYVGWRGSWEFFITLTGFLWIIQLFHWLESGRIADWLISLIFVASFLALFYFFHQSDWNWKKFLAGSWRRRAVYAGLMTIMLTEFFLVLKFFPVDEKNRAMMLILIFWYFNQVYYFYQQKGLSKMIAFNLTLTFLLIFGVILITLPFLGR